MGEELTILSQFSRLVILLRHSSRTLTARRSLSALSLMIQTHGLTQREKYAPGTVVTGKVARMADFGAFIELEPGVDALLHVSQISYEHVNKPEDVYKVGDEVEAVVVECNADDKKISLSVKELLPAPEYTDDVAEDTEE